MNNNGQIVIATGANRYEVAWKNHKIQWSQLVDKLRTTYRTRETVVEYAALTPAKKDGIKDIGGFVGGYIQGGHRLIGSIKYRTLLTLDLDSADPGVWTDMLLEFDCAAVLYSTHKHTPESPRYRLVLPLDRQVSSEEYEAIARMVAGKLGINLFDPTTFQPSRLMYWPSTPADGQYVFLEHDRPWLNADRVLDLYLDWSDSSSWPVHPMLDKIRSRSAGKQGDPREKSGLIGAFCSVYNIDAVMGAYLGEQYVPCDHMPGRYTFTGGTTSGGVVVYDNLWAYSHHSTDPVSGKLCNAFDLVRLHLYGEKDIEAAPDTPVNRLPSYGAMLDLVSADVEVRKWIGRQRMQRAKEAFGSGSEEGSDADKGMEDDPADDNWLELLAADRKGRYLETIDNILLILKHDPRLKGKIIFDVFAREIKILRRVPWRSVGKGEEWYTDRDDAGMRHYLEKVYEITAVQKIRDALDMLLIEYRCHPVREYLGGLQWDGQARVEELLIDYMGAEDTPYVRAVTRKTLVGAVARIYDPGCKFDYVLTLVGGQGQGKSTLFNKLAGKWFSDSFTGVNADNNKSFEQLQGVWIMEMAELAGVRKAEVEAIKHFITKQVDSYRPAYGHRLEHYPRQCILVASTNETMGFLRDDTGDRRFWPVTTRKQQPLYDIFTELTPDERDQIWAEAVTFYAAGEVLHLGELEIEANRIQEQHKVKDERIDVIAAYLEMPLPENWNNMTIHERQIYIKDEEEFKSGTVIRQKVCVAEIWCELFGGSFRDMTTNNTKYIHSMLSRIHGWSSSKNPLFFSPYGRHRAYVRNNN
jgi:predicted P-loop ATPase